MQNVDHPDPSITMYRMGLCIRMWGTYSAYRAATAGEVGRLFPGESTYSAVMGHLLAKHCDCSHHILIFFFVFILNWRTISCICLKCMI